MAINFPDSPTNGQVATVGGKNYTYNSTKNTWTPTQVTEADLSTVGSTTVVATHDLLPASPSAGDMALVSSVNKMYVYFNNKPLKVLGRISMDLITVDMSTLPKLKNSKKTIFVDIINKHKNINNISKIIDTIPYEILTSLSNRYKKVYI